MRYVFYALFALFVLLVLAWDGFWLWILLSNGGSP